MKRGSTHIRSELQNVIRITVSHGAQMRLLFCHFCKDLYCITDVSLRTFYHHILHWDIGKAPWFPVFKLCVIEQLARIERSLPGFKIFELRYLSKIYLKLFHKSVTVKFGKKLTVCFMSRTHLLRLQTRTRTWNWMQSGKVFGFKFRKCEIRIIELDYPVN